MKKERGLADLKPQDVEIKVEGKSYMIGKYSLFAKAHFVSQYGAKGFLEKLNEPSQEIIMSEIAYFLLDEQGKKDFPTLDDFRKALTSVKEQLDIISAVFKTMGFAAQSAKTVEEEKEKKK